MVPTLASAYAVSNRAGAGRSTATASAAEDPARFDALDAGRRSAPDPDETDPSTWGFEVPEA
jgi:hypothetical protein